MVDLVRIRRAGEKRVRAWHLYSEVLAVRHSANIEQSLVLVRLRAGGVEEIAGNVEDAEVLASLAPLRGPGLDVWSDGAAIPTADQRQGMVGVAGRGGRRW